MRREQDSMGTLEVPETALWGAQTQRAVENFPISGLKMPVMFLQALGFVKQAAASANHSLGLLPHDLTEAIIEAAKQIVDGELIEHFPVDVFQTGSGTSTNMNANEVISRVANTKLGRPAIHPNDHVNMSQSSNDVIPTAIHVSCSLAVHRTLLPALKVLTTTLTEKAATLHIAKTGRTHLMDAMPITFAQEFSGWEAQVQMATSIIEACCPRLQALGLGGTAVGTGINADADFGHLAAEYLTQATGITFRSHENYFQSLSSQDAVVALSSALRGLAVSLLKINNDLRWMNSGPIAGIGEITLPALQPGSSIMPGKVNPVIPEAICMACVQVMGYDTAIGIAGSSGNFQLNVMLPMIAYNILQSIELMANSCVLLATKSISGLTVNKEQVQRQIAKNPILVTALNPVIGYELGAKIAKQAYAEGRSVKDVALEMTTLSAEELDRLIEPMSLTKGGIQK